MTDQPTDPIGETTPETARALLWRHGLPEDVIDGALALHAGELAAVQRAAISKTDDPVFYESEAGWLINLITPDDDEPSPVVPVSSPPPDQTALRDRIASAARTVRLRLGPNAIAAAQRGDQVMLSGGEADEIAAAVLAVLPPPADRAAVLLQAAEHLLARCPHLGKPGALRKCTCAAAEELIRLASQESGTADYASAREDVLRRLAAEAPQPKPEAQPESCAQCGKPIRRITGTLTEWWVHVQGGRAFCYPWQPASSPRATPKPAVEAQQPDIEARP